MRRWIFELLLRAALALADSPKGKNMGFNLPTKFRVPTLRIESLGLDIAIFAVFNGMAQVGVFGVLVKETGAVDYTLVAGGVKINETGGGLKAYIVSKYAGDERKYLQTEIEPLLNEQLDAYMRANYSWEQYANSPISRTPQEIDAMPDGYDQANATLELYGALTKDEQKKTVQFYA